MRFSVSFSLVLTFTLSSLFAVRIAAAQFLDCKNLWWKDETHSTCSQKQFCGMYMYRGLQTFESQSECQGREVIPTAAPTSAPRPVDFIVESRPWYIRMFESIRNFFGSFFPVKQTNPPVKSDSQYACPREEYVNCMPIGAPGEPSRKCEKTYLDWAAKNCPAFKGPVY